MSAELVRKLELALARKKQAKAPTAGPSTLECDRAHASATGSTPAAVGDENLPPVIELVIAPSEDVMKDPSKEVSTREEALTERAQAVGTTISPEKVLAVVTQAEDTDGNLEGVPVVVFETGKSLE